MLTPRHAPAGQTVLIETEKGIVAITDMCSVLENFYPPGPCNRMMEIITPRIHKNVTKYDIIRDTADIIMPIHDIKWSTVDRIP